LFGSTPGCRGEKAEYIRIGSLFKGNAASFALK
jgi:hypothetical protein